MPVFPYRLMLDLLVNSNLLRIRNCLVVSLNSLVSTPPPHIQRQACSLVSVGGVEELCHAKDCWAWQRQLGDVAQWQPSPLENQIGHRYLTNEYVNLLKCWSWSWFDPRSCQQKLGKQRNHSFFSMQKQHKDHKDPKKQLHCYTDYIGSFGNDPLLSLGSCECWGLYSRGFCCLYEPWRGEYSFVTNNLHCHCTVAICRKKTTQMMLMRFSWWRYT